MLRPAPALNVHSSGTSTPAISPVEIRTSAMRFPETSASLRTPETLGPLVPAGEGEMRLSGFEVDSCLFEQLLSR